MFPGESVIFCAIVGGGGMGLGVWKRNGDEMRGNMDCFDVGEDGEAL